MMDTKAQADTKVEQKKYMEKPHKVLHDYVLKRVLSIIKKKKS